MSATCSELPCSASLVRIPSSSLAAAALPELSAVVHSPSLETMAEAGLTELVLGDGGELGRGSLSRLVERLHPEGVLLAVRQLPDGVSGVLPLQDLLPLLLSLTLLQDVGGDEASSIHQGLLPAQGDGVLGGLHCLEVCHWPRLFCRGRQRVQAASSVSLYEFRINSM